MDILHTYFGHALAYHVVMGALMFLGAMILGWIFKRILTTVGRRLAAKTANELDDIILEIVVDRVKWIAIVAGVYLATEELIRGTEASDLMARQWLGYAQGVIFVCFVSVVTLVLIRIADASVKHTMEVHAKRTSSRINEAVFPLLNRLIMIIIALIALIITLHHFGEDVSSLVVSLGVGSLAVALAAQETLANMIAGFVIITDRPFRSGDRIKIPTGEIGDVQEIGIRSTKILDFDNNLIVSPNAELIKGKIVNFSYPNVQIRIAVDVSIAYGSDLDRAKSLITDLALQHPDVLKNPAPAVYLVSFGDSSLNLQLNGRTDDYRKKFPIETVLREQIYRAFSAAKISFAIPQQIVHLSNAANVNP